MRTGLADLVGQLHTVIRECQESVAAPFLGADGRDPCDLLGDVARDLQAPIPQITVVLLIFFSGW